jgi:cell division protein DivIC
MARRRRSREFKNNTVIDIQVAREERRLKRVQAGAKKTQKEKRPREELSRRKTVKILRRRLIYGGIFILIAVIIGLSVYNLVFLKLEEARAEAQLEALQQEKSELEEELAHVDSHEYIEQQAREELRMILPGETLYVLKKEEDDATEN